MQITRDYYGRLLLGLQEITVQITRDYCGDYKKLLWGLQDITVGFNGLLWVAMEITVVIT